MYKNKTAPTRLNGTASITIIALNDDLVLAYSNRKTRRMVRGRIIFRRSRTRSIFSYWPLQTSE